jgi:hypothetical protein
MKWPALLAIVAGLLMLAWATTRDAKSSFGSGSFVLQIIAAAAGIVCFVVGTGILIAALFASL